MIRKRGVLRTPAEHSARLFDVSSSISQWISNSRVEHTAAHSPRDTFEADSSSVEERSVATHDSWTRSRTRVPAQHGGGGQSWYWGGGAVFGAALQEFKRGGLFWGGIVFKNSRIQEFKNSRMKNLKNFKNSRIQELKNSRIQEFDS